jgi:hypothetical protein
VVLENRPFYHAAPVALPGAGAFLLPGSAVKKSGKYFFLLLTQYAANDMIRA